jgi:hypothetical protein
LSVIFVGPVGSSTAFAFEFARVRTIIVLTLLCQSI